MQTDPEIIARLDRIEAMLKQLALANSPASLSVDEKVVIMAKAMKKGKAAMKEAAKQINGQ